MNKQDMLDEAKRFFNMADESAKSGDKVRGDAFLAAGNVYKEAAANFLPEEPSRGSLVSYRVSPASDVNDRVAIRAENGYWLVYDRQGSYIHRMEWTELLAWARRGDSEVKVVEA